MPSPVNSIHQTHHSHTTQNTESQKDRKTVLETHGYFLGKTIGAGSYATVRMAHSELHGGNVAIKIVSKYTAPEDYLKKFLPREIEVVKGLKHPNLIRFLQAIETTHRVYIVMEYAENGSLLDIIRKESFIQEQRARKWFRQLVDAIEYCHERGVVHRDIKCENLLMDINYNIKVSDFGFARTYVKHQNGHPVLSETFCGSYAYASPEILRGIPYQPHQSDIWSMGVVLYAMVFGRLPFDDTNYSLLLKQVSNKVTFPRDPKASSACKALINKILAPLKVRARISGIRTDAWFNYTTTDKAGSSKEGSEVSQIRVPSRDAITLVTKKQLKDEVKRKEKANAAEEETQIATQSPETPNRSEDKIKDKK
ncbi:PREDICTED: testis-specific serine/threonine-protein kinase 3-like isoform X2 [Nicrophorus vespilloides]|uniref:Testis-specific serine/threonine-protein kinase 3-like isoform X2 n=1 Tax=Nicrophorus vespilloides TaxID=110193 RepID=A0ABM1NB26_NICVS|nr:PREDICTED: testis-specific serine/threonine-protein kinase 3-like isoform X2 [Nicrophorus vespilloides]